MTKPTPNFARILAPSATAPDTRESAYRTAADGKHGGVALTEEEIRGILEVAWLMANANGPANVEEMRAFEALSHHLAPGVPVHRTASQLGRGDVDEDAVRRAAAKLSSRTAREAAYKAAYTIRVVDLESNEAEDEIDALLVEVLGLADRAGDLAFDVNDALASA